MYLNEARNSISLVTVSLYGYTQRGMKMRYLNALAAAELELSQLQDGQWLPEDTRVLKLGDQWLSVKQSTYLRHKAMKIARIIKRPLKRETLAWLKNLAQLAMILLVVGMLVALAGSAIVKGFQLVTLALADKVAPTRTYIPERGQLFEHHRMNEEPHQADL